jgi:hypothetical protein
MPIFESNGVNIPKLAVTPTNLPIAGEVKYYASTSGSMKRIDSSGVVTDAVDSRSDGFISSRSSTFVIDIIYLDPTTGVDGLDDSAYKNNPANKFLTLSAAITWVNKFEGLNVRIVVTGTTAGARLTLSSYVILSAKSYLEINGSTNATGVCFLDFAAAGGILEIRRCNVALLNCNININRNDALAVRSYSSLQLNNTVITLGVAVIYGLSVSGASATLIILSNNTFNFTANGQAYIHPSNNTGCTVIFANHSTNNVWVSGAFTGLNWVYDLYYRSVTTFFVVNTPPPTIPSNINMNGSFNHYGSFLSLGDQVYSDSNYSYPLNVGTSKPVRFTGLNASSANGAFTTKRLIGVNQIGELIPVTGGKDEFLATASQTAFTLTAAPAGLVAAYKAGVLLPNTAFTFSGTAATYVPAENGGLVLALNDRINFIY